MKLLGRILAVLLAALGSVLAVQLALRRFYHRWHAREIVWEEDEHV